MAQKATRKADPSAFTAAFNPAPAPAPKGRRKATPAAPAPAADASLSLAIPAPAPVAAPVAAPALTPEGYAQAAADLASLAGQYLQANRVKDGMMALSLRDALVRGNPSEKQVAFIVSVLSGGLDAATNARGDGIIGAYLALPQQAGSFPKIDTLVDGQRVVVAFTGAYSLKAQPENRGTATVTNGGAFKAPGSAYYGRILKDGTFRAAGNCPPAILKWVASYKPEWAR